MKKHTSLKAQNPTLKEHKMRLLVLYFNFLGIFFWSEKCYESLFARKKYLSICAIRNYFAVNYNLHVTYLCFSSPCSLSKFVFYLVR